MKCLVEGTTVKFSGILNEASVAEVLVGSLEQAWKAQGSKGRLVLDFSAVEYANSCGLRCWMNVQKVVQMPFKLVRVPSWLATQFGVVGELLEHDIEVESILAPFYDSKADEVTMELLTLGADVPFLDDYSDFEPKILKEGRTLQPEFDPERFFLFMTELRDRRKG